MPQPEPVLTVEGLRKSYPGPQGPVAALRELSFALLRGRSLAIVGESGSGKTTAALCIARLKAADAGRVWVGGTDLLQASAVDARRLRRHFGIVMQDPLSALDPRWPIWRSIAEPLQVHEPRLDRAARRSRALEWMERVGLGPALADAVPHRLSGGQLQRAVLARALILRPQLLILDEPTSALDVSVQAQVLNLLCDLREEFGLSYLFITHNLALVEILADEVIVMYAGAAVECGAAATLFAQPRHPYTVELLAAVPDPDPGRGGYFDRVLSAAAAPAAGAGCAYATRCALAEDRCRAAVPAVATVAQPVACFVRGAPPAAGRASP